MRWRRARSALAAVLLASLAAGSAEAGPSPAADYVVGAWELYKHKFLTPEGRIVDDDNGQVSHSEGQGYGMLIAVAANDRQSFDRMLDWYRRNLRVRPDGLAAWKWDPNSDPHVQDRNNASDGDLLIAWALVRASRQWGDASLRAEAKGILEALGREATADSAYGKLLLPGVDGFAGDAQPDAPVVNLSYWVFPALEELGSVTAAFPAADLLESGLRLAEGGFGPRSLPADWMSLAGEAPTPAAAFPAEFGYNAIRIPLYVAWRSAGQAAALSQFAEAWADNPDGLPAVTDLETGKATSPLAQPGYAAIVDLVSCSLGRTRTADRAMRFAPTSYYPSTLHLLSLIAIVERYPQCAPNT